MEQTAQNGSGHGVEVQNGLQERPEGNRASEARDSTGERDSATGRVDSGSVEVEPGDGGHRGVQQSVSEEANGRNVTKQKENERTEENRLRLRALETHFGKRGSILRGTKKNIGNIRNMRD